MNMYQTTGSKTASVEPNWKVMQCHRLVVKYTLIINTVQDTGASFLYRFNPLIYLTELYFDNNNRSK